MTPAATGAAISVGSARDTARPYALPWERALVLGAVLAAALAVWLTLRAGFLAYPGWLAVQKADFILGPIGVRLYWRHSRPNSRFGLLRVVPDALRLAFTLYRDQTLPRAVRWRLRIALIYNIQPINLLPDFVPVVGFADNVAVLSWAIRGTVRAAGEDAVVRHWRGSPESLATLYRALRLPAGSTGIPDARLVNCER